MYIIGQSVTENNVELLGTGYLYAPVIFDHLMYKSVFIPGLTYNDEVANASYNSSASIEIPKYIASGLDNKPVAPNKSTSFNENSSDFNLGVVTLKLCNVVIGQRPIRLEMLNGAYAHQSSSGVWTNIEASVMRNLTRDKMIIRESSALGMLIKGSKNNNLAVAVTSSNVKDILLDARAKMSGEFAEPDVVLCSTKFYASVVSYAGKDFTPYFNDLALANGKVGHWLGMWFVECQLLNGLDDTKAYYVDPADCSTLKYVPTGGVNFIMYDHMAFNIQDCLLTSRVIMSEDSSSKKAQLEMLTGSVLTDEKCSLVSWSNIEPVEATYIAG